MSHHLTRLPMAGVRVFPALVLALIVYTVLTAGQAHKQGLQSADIYRLRAVGEIQL
jgi:hypothetical protein